MTWLRLVDPYTPDRDLIGHIVINFDFHARYHELAVFTSVHANWGKPPPDEPVMVERVVLALGFNRDEVELVHGKPEQLDLIPSIKFFPSATYLHKQIKGESK